VNEHFYADKWRSPKEMARAVEQRIPAMRDHVVQGAARLVIESIFKPAAAAK
jgi:hypothetical protein